ncbi:membrane protein insertase YidC [Geopsychrobacter electrodiphilus]|uniref:membrane protein insertase YidC n=1 Tax=Geopsychrobacter electrodiphilus TaxID=225196 RepID=UPI000361E366|nr:membrane protein insertase YidC [Geopsychrobacter electrodiphilus]
MENKRTLIAIALVLFLWTGYNFLYPSTHEKPAQEQSVVEKVVPVDHSGVAVQKRVPLIDMHPSAQPAKERRIKVKSDLFELVFSSDGARLIDGQLNKFKQTNSKNSPFVKIVDEQSGEKGTYGFFGGDGFNLPPNAHYTFDGNSNEVLLSSTEKSYITFKTVTAENIQITKTFTFYPNKYYFDVNVIVNNLSNQVKNGNVNFSLVSNWDDSKKSDRYNFVGAVTYDGNKLYDDEPKKLKEESKTYGSNILWTSFTTKYFSNIVKPIGDSLKNITIEFNNDSVINIITSPPFSIQPGGSHEFKYKNYLGPRDYDLLKQTGLSFENIIDLGFFGIIARPLMVALKFFYGFLGNYGFAIILLTVCIKAIFWPLTQKSYSSMNAMKNLQPQMAKLRAKHGKDKQKLNQEMMALYKENRVNPFGGCLPMVIQIPVFFALYRVLLESIELRHAPFMLWITDLSAADTLISDAFHLGFALGPLPLIMGFTMFLQQRMTPTTMDPTQAKVMMFMPVFFTFIFLSFPSGLVIYWLVNNLLTIAQQYFINRTPARS